MNPPDKKRASALRVIAGVAAGVALAFAVRGCGAARHEAPPASAQERASPGIGGVNTPPANPSAVIDAPAESAHAPVVSESPVGVADAAPAPNAEEEEAVARLSQELTTDFAPFIEQFNLSSRAAEVLIETLVGQSFASTEREKQDYQNLLEMMLSPEAYTAFQGYRNHVARGKRANAAMGELATAFPTISPDTVEEVRGALVSVFPTTSAFDELRAGDGPISDGDIERAKKEYLDSYTKRLSELEPHVSKQQIEFLKAWYLQSPELLARIQAVKQLQQTRGAPPKTK